MRAVEQHTDTMETFGSPSQTTICTISLEGGLMRTLVSGLYSDGPKTVVREIIANALDSHIASGKKDVPIEVWMPTQIDSYFTVRDFGTGMSDEFIREKYSAISYSSKTDDNAQTGAFGVGSKSPFAISDNFSIRCFDKDGMVRSYSIYFNDKQQIAVDLMFKTKAKAADRAELGGVEVRVPIAGKVNYHIMLKALREQQIIYFDKNIKWDGVSKTNLSEWQKYAAITPKAEGAILLGKINSVYAYRGESYVRQGSAVYPLSYTQMSEMPSEVSDLIHQMLSNKEDLIFDVPIGTCDVTAAREDLQYNTTSVKNLIDFISTAVLNYAQFLRDVVDQRTDAWDILDALDKQNGVDIGGFDQLRSAETRFTLAMACARIAPALPFVKANPWSYSTETMQRRIHSDLFLDKGYDVKDAAIIVNNSNGSSRKYSITEVNRHDCIYIISKGLRDWNKRVHKHHSDLKTLRRAVVVRVRKDQLVHFYKIAKKLYRNVLTESDLPAATPVVKLAQFPHSYPKFGHKGFHSGYDTLDIAVPGAVSRDFYVVASSKNNCNKFFVKPIVSSMGDAVAENDSYIYESDVREFLTKTAWMKEVTDNVRVFKLTPKQFYKLKKSGKLPAQELTRFLSDKYAKDFDSCVPNYVHLLDWSATSHNSTFCALMEGTEEQKEAVRTIFKYFPFFATTYGVSLARRDTKTDHEKFVVNVAKFLKIKTDSDIGDDVRNFLSNVPITLPTLSDNPLLMKLLVAGLRSDKKWKPATPPKELLTYYEKALDRIEKTV